VKFIVSATGGCLLPYSSFGQGPKAHCAQLACVAAATAAYTTTTSVVAASAVAATAGVALLTLCPLELLALHVLLDRRQ
jgi:hypothetical protein